MKNPLAQRRMEVGLTQVQAAQLAGVTPSAWCSWEQWRAVPVRSRFAGIANSLRWSIEEVAEAVSTLQLQTLRREVA